MLDTVIIIDNSPSDGKIQKFELTKIYYDSIGVHPHELKTSFFEHVDNLNVIGDSLSRFNYHLGLNFSNKGVNKLEFKESKTRTKDHWGYTEEYTVTDMRFFKNDTVYSHSSKHKFHFTNKESKEAVLKKYYIPKTFIWTSLDNRITYFAFLIICSEFDEYGNEILTTLWASDMKQ